jgi:hypothetical protein
VNAASGSVSRVDDAALALLAQYWGLIQARDWAGAQALLAPDAICTWWATRERFVGAAAIIHVNAVYPEGWRLDLLDLQCLADGRVLSLVRVEQHGQSFYATSFFALQDGRINSIDEYWCDVQAAPVWRAGMDLLGYQVFAADGRQGLAHRQG